MSGFTGDTHMSREEFIKITNEGTKTMDTYTVIGFLGRTTDDFDPVIVAVFDLDVRPWLDKLSTEDFHCFAEIVEASSADDAATKIAKREYEAATGEEWTEPVNIVASPGR